MRKELKKQVDSFMAIMVRANECIHQKIVEQETTNALRLLGDCQDGAAVLQTLIEKYEGAELSIVCLLKKYCELAHVVYESLETEENQKVKCVLEGEDYKKFCEVFAQIANCVNDEIKVRKEVVFLPYKASMWDSLESVWAAADKDDSCDAYVIPIPYYDKKSDGSFGEYHYEIDKYPANVPVINYRNYDFEERRPDEVYIHSPYDECNFVTSVEPFYYSKNLKKYTDRLVYIPYFVLEEPNVKDEAALEAMAHFVTVPAVVYADQVIVQSETMREAYIKIMEKFMKEQGLKREYWERKILGTGSPKFDKITGLTKENIDIPEAWRRKITRPDGTMKKIVLYNTTVSGLLEHSERYIAKMMDVFRIFEKNKEHVMLLWRPHPLIQATISSMRPELWEAFQKVKKEFLEAGWGIYDDSADLDRAIVLSDAYYGDGSSVVHLCQRVKMPVMIQNCETADPFCNEYR